MPKHLLSTVSEKHAAGVGGQGNVEPKHDPRSLVGHCSQHIDVPCSLPLGPSGCHAAPRTISQTHVALSLVFLGRSPLSDCMYQ